MGGEGWRRPGKLLEPAYIHALVRSQPLQVPASHRGIRNTNACQFVWGLLLIIALATLTLSSWSWAR